VQGAIRCHIRMHLHDHGLIDWKGITNQGSRNTNECMKPDSTQGVWLLDIDQLVRAANEVDAHRLKVHVIAARRMNV
jgi:hypothetical protein